MFFLEITKQEIKKLKILGNSVEFKKPFSFQLTSPKQPPDKKKFAEPFIYADFANLTCDSVGARTQDLLLRRQLLYPAELPNQPY